MALRGIRIPQLQLFITTSVLFFGSDLVNASLISAVEDYVAYFCEKVSLLLLLRYLKWQFRKTLLLTYLDCHILLVDNSLASSSQNGLINISWDEGCCVGITSHHIESQSRRYIIAADLLLYFNAKHLCRTTVVVIHFC